MIIEIDEAVRRIRADEVVAYPTETVYGLGIDPRSERARARLLDLKGREGDRGLSLLVSGIEVVEHTAAPLPENARRLMERHWPGPLTVVVPVAPEAFPGVRTELGVGFRCSPQPTARELVVRLGSPLVSTSANRSGEPPCSEAAQVEQTFGRDFPIAGGEPAGGSLPSTVVAVSPAGEIKCLREGAVPFAELEKEL